MDWLESLILGIIQGLTEFLPVSSTGHLFLGRLFFGLEEAGLFLDTMLHVGTLIAILAVYRSEIVYLIKNPFSRLSFLLIVGTIPTVFIGLLFKDFFEEISKTGVTIGWEFLVTGMILWISDRVKDNGTKVLEEISYTDAFIIGTFQGAAILPAISRSGLTIAAALFRKINKATAAYFSFLLSIPAITGATGLQILSIWKGETANIPLMPLLVGILSSAVFGYIAVKWMIAILKRGSLKGFAIYVWCLGIIILVYQHVIQ